MERIPATEEISLSDHAVEQYRDRVKPALDLEQARVELERMLGAGTVTDTAPPWVRPAEQRDFYLLLADVALPLRRNGRGAWFATTCITQQISEGSRMVRKAKKASRSSKKRARRNTRIR